MENRNRWNRVRDGRQQKCLSLARNSEDSVYWPNLVGCPVLLNRHQAIEIGTIEGKTVYTQWFETSIGKFA